MKKILFYLFFLVVAQAIVCAVSAYEIPKEDSRAKYFYVFGPQGSPDYGAEDFTQEIYINMPKNEAGDLSIYIYDPDTGDFRDLRSSPENPWDTVTEFTVYGKDGKALAKEEFARSVEFDRNHYEFKPFSKEEGQPYGDFYQFRLVARGIAGDDANLFRVSIFPYSAEAFSFNITFRLLEPKGEKMYFYPQLPAGAKNILVENYDIDPNGGISQLYDPASGSVYPVNDSASGRWTATELQLPDTGRARRLEYRVTKKTQKYAHAGIRVKDDNGNLLPIYFRKSGPYVEASVVRAPEPVRPKKAEGKCNEFTFDATKSYDPDNQALSFHWDFGDGSTSAEPVVTHVYQKAGEYKVTLTVKDDSGLECDTTTTTETVKANTAPKPAFTSAGKACLGNEVVFDAGLTPDDPLGAFTYLWDFGDGTTGQGRKVTKQYKKGGSYIVTLTVDDNKQTACSAASAQKNIYINTPPIADAGKDIQKCVSLEQDYEVIFDGARSIDADSDALSYYWDFGDGASGTGAKPAHTYKKGGSYTVKLRVNDGRDTSCSTDTDTVSVKLNKQPVADAGPNLVCCVNSESVFDGSGSRDDDGDKLAYKWEFGDGSTAEGPRATHVYSKRGKYLVTLTVDDGSGMECSASTDSFEAVVNESPVAVINVR